MKEWLAELSADFQLNFVDGGRWKWIVQGLGNTLLITLLSLLLGIVLGVVVAAIRSTYDKNKEAMQMHKQDAQTRMEELRRWCETAKKKFGEGGLTDVMCRSFAKRREKLMEKFRKIDEK